MAQFSQYAPRVEMSASAQTAMTARGLSPQHATMRGFNYDMSGTARTLAPHARYSPRAPGTRIKPFDVQTFHKYTRHLPDRYVSNENPHSTPLHDSHILLSHAKLSFQRKLHRLRLVFERADANNNGLVPATLVRPALATAGKFSVILQARLDANSLSFTFRCPMPTG